ncbi:MAG TPA: ASKHA domain-containing protein [Spirochaetia bacterium]|nr:ASKHA domain-containing protein [Spirochaetia bacterium]
MKTRKREGLAHPIIVASRCRRRVKPDGLSRKVLLSVPPPSLADNRADRERVAEGLVGNQVGLEIPLDILREFPSVLRQGNWQVTATLGRYRDRWRLAGLEPGDTTARHFGLAIDLGTTTVVAYLVDMGTGRVLDTAAGYNAQIALGEDILTRIQTGSAETGLLSLREAALVTVNGLISQLAQNNHIPPAGFAAAVVAGNTSMIHFLLGLDPARICLAPYSPAANRPGCFSAGEAGLAIPPNAPVYFLPGVGSYVGGDIVAGILASGLHRRSEISLFVDIGTNGEMVLGNRDWLVACAGAAGPALEGGVAGAGMRAEAGAIERVSIDPDSGRVSYVTIGGDKPRGLCGSGLVDSMAELLLAGIIDRSGRFRDGRRSFSLVPAADSATGRDITITQTDLNNLLRTKGAVNAALEYLLESVGLPMQAIERFYAAGAFGQYLPLESAVTIGLYPDLDRRRMVRLGNSSGEGARLVLISRRKLREAEELAGKITYFELNASDVFMQKFVGSRFLPHTDLSLFPSVREKFAKRGLL